MLISGHNMKLTYEWHKAIQLKYINTRTVVVVLRFPSTLHVQSQRERAWAECRLKEGHAHCTGSTSREPGTVCRTARRPHFSLAIISVTVQLRIQVFSVISVYFNLRNILPKSGTFPRNTLYMVSNLSVSQIRNLCLPAALVLYNLLTFLYHIL